MRLIRAKKFHGPQATWYFPLVISVVLAVTLMSLCAGFASALAQGAQPQEVAPDSMPQSLQEKMQRLHELVGQRQQEGVDLQPVGELMQGVAALM